jgi:hypothetical protein
MSLTKTTCAGCGLLSDTFGQDIAPGINVQLCRNLRGSSYDPKVACLRAALDKYRPCAGCGRKLAGSQWLWRELCETCRKGLSRYQALGDPKPQLWAVIDKNRLLGDYISEVKYRSDGPEEDEARAVIDKLHDALLRALGGRQDSGLPPGEKVAVNAPQNAFHSITTGMVCVEMDRDRAEGLKDLLKMLADVGTAQYKRGLRDGHHALSRLARGETTVSDYEGAYRKKVE